MMTAVSPVSALTFTSQDLQLAEPRDQLDRLGPAAPGRLHGSFGVCARCQQVLGGADAATDDTVVEELPAEVCGT